MTWEINCADMCRACMKIDGVLLPMYDDDTISSKNLPNKLAELTSIQIDRFDGLPNMLCAKCAYRTDAFYDFKLQVQATEKKLRKMFETHIHPNSKEDEEKNNEYQQENNAEVNHALVVKSLDDKFSDSSLNLEQLEDPLSEVAHVNGDVEDPLEIDVWHLVQANGHIDKSNLSLKNILITKPQESDTKEINTEIPDELSKILEAQNLDYTIMYISESEMDALQQENMSSDLIRESEIQGKSETVKEEQEESNNEIAEDKNVEYLNINANEETNVMELKFKSNLSNNDACKNSTRGTQVHKDSQERNQQAEESESSESDYFVDPKDNILGSLNDTITRIKEIKLEGDIMQYQCTLCLQNYDKLTGVLLHTIDNHVPSSGPFFCVVCEKDCESHRELRAHVKTHTGPFPYSCFICNKAYTMKRYLKRHMVCHTDFPRHRCPKCGLRFKVKSELETHISTHIHGAPYACSQCPRVFNHKGNYKRHLITHLDPQGLHLPKYPCKVCGKRFLNNRTLETHMRVHTGEKPFKCEVCGRSFSQQGNLLNHVRIHSNPRSYTCEVCGKRFNQRATLRDHSLLHTGEKPYVCNVCGVAFTFSAALRRHMWTHTGGKPFGCEICSARFVGKYDLRRHMRVHMDKQRTKRRKNTVQENESHVEVKEEEMEVKEEFIIVDPNTDTVLIEQVLLTQDATNVSRQQESEKENVDALFNLIQYG